MWKLYYAPFTCALASHIALEKAGADYEAERVDFGNSAQKSPEYLRVNPKGRVPALITEHGVLTETPAILAFIAQRFPGHSLAPCDDPWLFAKAQEFNSYLCATVHVAHAHKYRGYRWADDAAAMLAMQEKVPQSVGECFELIESELLAGPWVMGQRYSICDPYLFTVGRWLEGDGVESARFPKVLAHRERMLEDAAVQHVLEIEEGTL